MNTRVAIVGGFQNGKSTLINCLLGARVATVGQGLATTRITVEYRYGDKNYVAAVGPSGERFETPVSEFVRAKSGYQWETCRRASVYLKNPMLEQLELIDTPGLDASEPDTARSLASTESADFVILLMTRGFPAGNPQFTDFIRRALSERHYALVLNCGRECPPDINTPAAIQIEQEIVRWLERLGLTGPRFTQRVNLGWVYRDLICKTAEVRQREKWTAEELLQRSGLTSFRDKLIAEAPRHSRDHYALRSTFEAARGASGGLTKIKHSTGVVNTLEAIGFDGEGKIIASGGEGGRIVIWAPQTGRLLLAPGWHSGYIRCAAINGSHQLLATGRKRIKLWDMKTGRLIWRYKYLNSYLTCMALSSTAQTIAYSYAREIYSVSVNQRRALNPRLSHDASIKCLAYSPEGKRLASGSDDALVILWNRYRGTKAATLAGHKGPVTAVVFSPDGELLVSGGTDKMIRIWEVRSGQMLRQLKGHRQAVQCLNFSTDGRTLISASQDGQIKIWGR